jgi:hypothetical protein
MANMIGITGFKFVVAATLVLSASTFSIFPGISAAEGSRSQTTVAVQQIQQECQSPSQQPVAFIADPSYTHGNAILWQPPVDIECRDLFYGVGGPEGAPDPSRPFTYVRRSKSGTQKKIIVEDVHGREWTVKFGPEARPETTATRLVWAAGYHVDQDYFVPYARIVGEKNIVARNVRFERRDDGYKDVGTWEWKHNPFLGSPEFERLKVLMALLKNWDLKTSNNDILVRKKEQGPYIYYVADLGATFGATGNLWNKIPLLGDTPPAIAISSGKTKGNPRGYAGDGFIKEVRGDRVYFQGGRTRFRKVFGGVSVANARWVGNLLGRLSNKQLYDAFHAGGFDAAETGVYVSILRARITTLQRL